MRNSTPLVSFTFDDFPKSALWTGGAILQHHGLAGTYYASMGLMAKESPTGEMFSSEDLEPLLDAGHELGCHTFGHCHAWNTAPREFEESMLANRRAVGRLFPQLSLRTLSYPILCPRPHTKRRVGRHFLCCRGGGQTFNRGVADLNNLRAFFIERSWGDFGLIRDAIDRNRRSGGWLIFATHDVCDSPTPYGCTPGYFEDTVQHSIQSGATILPVASACELVLRGPYAKRDARETSVGR